MAERTGIAWTESTWNPWTGCQKVSPGCRNCYAEALTTKFGGDFSVVRKSKSTFKDPLKWKTPRLIFACSMSDFFIEAADEWRSQAWDIIRATPQHTYQILTKRPDNIRARLPEDWGDGWPNVWLGVSAENQMFLEKRIPILRDIPASLRFVSCEPLLERVDFGKLMDGVGWVIAGGESGPNRRPFDKIWVRQLRDECLRHDVPFFFKQGSGLRPGMDDLLDGDEWKETPRKPILILGADRDKGAGWT